MRRVWSYILLSGALAGSLSATSVLSCSFNGGLFSTSGCYAMASFSFAESLDWAAAYGSADAVNNPNAIYDPIANGPWNAMTAGGLTVGTTLGPGYTGTQTTIQRVDNFQMVFLNGSWQFAAAAGYENYALFSGMFDAQPNSGAGDPGDHLLYTNNGQGPLQLNFSSGISGAMFRISTPTSGDVNATVSAYSVANPTALDIPIMTYSIIATNAAGSCAGLVGGPPVPCNLAPYIGIQGMNGNIRSLVISSTDTAGLFIDTLYLDNGEGVPEPGTSALMAGAVTLLAVLARRKQVRRT